MKFTAIPAAIAVTLLAGPSTILGKSHRHLEHSIGHMRPHLPVQAAPIAKRSGKCQFPTDDPNMVAVTPDEKNAGWAMSPDQECKPGSYCPFACKPGMVMNQWEPDSTYDYPSSMVRLKPDFLLNRQALTNV